MNSLIETSSTALQDKYCPYNTCVSNDLFAQFKMIIRAIHSLFMGLEIFVRHNRQ